MIKVPKVPLAVILPRGKDSVQVRNCVKQICSVSVHLVQPDFPGETLSTNTTDHMF